MPPRPPGRPLAGARLRTVDRALAGGLSAVGLAEAVLVLGTDRPAGVVLAALLPLPLLARHRRPLAAALTVAAGFVVQLPEPLRVFDRTVTCYAVALLAAYSLGRCAGPRAAPAGTAGAAAAIGGIIGGTDGSLLSGLLAAALVSGAAATGRAVATRVRLRQRLEAQTGELAASADDAAEAAATAVRAQLAGEVQGVVRRQVERMLDGARDAQRLVPSRAENAAEVIGAIETAGRQALEEMRRMLGLLRGGAGAAPLTPATDPGCPSEAGSGPLLAPSAARRRRADWPAPAVIALAAGESAWAAAESGAPWPVVVSACLAGAATAAPLLVRRSFPVAASVAAWAIVCGAAAVLPPPFAALVLIATLLAYAAGSAAGRAAWAGLAVGWGGVVALNLVMGAAGAGNVAVPALLVTLAWLAGRAAAEQVRLARLVAERNQELAVLRDARAAAAATQERLRIARELHDVVAHTLMVMVVQAGAARRMLSVDTDRALAALAVVRETGDGALIELHRLLTLVDPDSAPGPARLRALVDRARETGLAVDLRVDGRLDSLPGGVGLAVHRIVQEALTNAIRHAAATSVVVDLRVGAREVEVCVRDDGDPVARPGSAGNGIAGMRERVGLHGGAFSAAPTAAGFVVSASLPLGTGAEVQPA